MKSFANSLPYRGAKATLWEGGTKAVSFVNGPSITNPGTEHTG